tara:strand:+ start:5200 stop:5589 length:390 start_codon:yes stop_codon:yes gene_type:complete
MGSIRRNRSTFGSNKKPFAGGTFDRREQNELLFAPPPSDRSAALSRAMFARAAGVLPPSQSFERFQASQDFETNMLGPDREAERVNPYNANVGARIAAARREALRKVRESNLDWQRQRDMDNQTGFGRF